MEAPIIYNPAIHSHFLPSLASLLRTAILSPPYLIAGFLPPLDETKLLAFWTAKSAEVVAGERVIFLQLAPAATSEKVESIGDGVSEEGLGREVVGVVMLSMSITQTEPWRGGVEKLIVSPEWRGKGIARRLVQMLEGVAVENGRGLLVIYAEGGAPGSSIYPGWGYTHWGTLPKSEVSPFDGSLKDGVYFYKDLRNL